LCTSRREISVTTQNNRSWWLKRDYRKIDKILRSRTSALFSGVTARTDAVVSQFEIQKIDKIDGAFEALGETAYA
jgi:hypothetical protein